MAHVKHLVKLPATHPLEDLGRDPVVVEGQFKHRYVARQVLLVHPAKKPQSVAQAGPDAFDGVDVHLPMAVPIAVFGPRLGVVDRLVFFPTEQIVGTSEAVGRAYEDVYIDTDDGETLHGWWVPAEDPRGTALFFHGNAGNISGRIGTARFFVELGMNVLLVDYRGYGQSTGAPSEDGLYRDADASWRHLTEVRGVAPESILIAGRSLGSGPATYLASRTAPGGLLLESAFTSLTDVGARAYPILPVRWLSRLDFDNESRIAQVNAPVLMIHSPDDEVVPYDLGRALFAVASEPKTFVDITGGHNAMRTDQPGYRQAVHTFIRENGFGR